MSDSRSLTIEIQEVDDPIELSEARAQRERFDRNSAWLQKNLPAIYKQHRGKFICIAGEQLFVGHSAKEAIGQAAAAFPDDNGRFTRYIAKENIKHIYAL